MTGEPAAGRDPVRIQDEVLDCLRRLPPRPCHALRVGAYRVVFEHELLDGRRTIPCVFPGRRKRVHEVFQGRLLE